MDGSMSQLTSKSILNLASEFTRANSVCPDTEQHTPSYLQLLTKSSENDDKKAANSNSNNSSSMSVSSFSNMSKSTKSQVNDEGEHNIRPYLVTESDIKSSKSNIKIKNKLFSSDSNGDDNVFSKFGKIVSDVFNSNGNGNSKTLSDIKKMLTECQKVINKEIEITEYSHKYHSKQIIAYSEESKQQRNQLYSWALTSLIVDFEKMWSCKVRLSALLEEMAESASQILIKCRNEINFLLFEMSPDFEGKELYLKPPVEILSLDATQQRLLKQVQQVEKELNLAQLKVESLLPRLEPRSKRQRSSILNEVISKHQALSKHRHKLFGFDHSSNWDHDQSMKLSGLIIETKDESRRKKVDRKFSETVSDERTREGRLLRRWCGLNQGYSHMADQGFSSSNPTSSDTHTMSKDGEILNPRSVLAFCKYFGESVVATAFELDVENNAELAETLTELSMSLVFTRIEPTITNYLRMSADAERRDGLWRKRVKYLKNKTPEEIGIPKEFIDFTLLQSDLDKGHEEDGTHGSLPASSSLDASFASSSFSPSSSYNDTSHSLNDSSMNLSSTSLPPHEDSGTSISPVSPTDRSLNDMHLSGIRESGETTSTSTSSSTHGKRKNYWRTSLLLSKLDSSVVPHEAMYWFMAAMRMLHKEAFLVAGNKPLDADTMFPILVYAAVQGGAPWMHQNLFFLRHFSLVAEAATLNGSSGESDYYLTCTEAAISHVMAMEIDFGEEENSTDISIVGAEGDDDGIEANFDEGFFKSDADLYGERCSDNTQESFTDLRSSIRGPGSSDSFSTRGSSSPPSTSAMLQQRVNKADRVLGNTEDNAVRSTSESTRGDKKMSVKRGTGLMGSLFGSSSEKSGDVDKQSTTPKKAVQEDDKSGEEHAMEKLGNWLGAQEAMEDTLDVLEQGGWMD